MTRTYNRNFWSDRFAQRTGPVWSRLGPIHSISERMTAAEALEMHGMLADYVTAPTSFIAPDGTQHEDGGKAILRQKRGGGFEHMATVPQNFQIVQPRDIANLLDTPFAGGESITQRWPVDTVGTKSKGGAFFITLNAGGYDVRGDQMQRYFLIRNGNDGGTALTVGVIHVRLACWNSMSAALKGASVKITIPHVRSAPALLRTYTNAIAHLEMAQATVQGALSRLADTKISDEDARAILQRTFAIPSAPAAVKLFGQLQDRGVDLEADDVATLENSVAVYERKARSMAEKQEKAFERFRAFNDTDGRDNGTAGTAWSIFNAVTEVLDNMAGHGDTDDARDNAALESLFGRRATMRDQAFSAIYEYVQVR